MKNAAGAWVALNTIAATVTLKGENNQFANDQDGGLTMTATGAGQYNDGPLTAGIQILAFHSIGPGNGMLTVYIKAAEVPDGDCWNNDQFYIDLENVPDELELLNSLPTLSCGQHTIQQGMAIVPNGILR